MRGAVKDAVNVGKEGGTEGEEWWRSSERRGGCSVY
jgi:hypothetical protein